jgi:signal transduction histidine kinase
VHGNQTELGRVFYNILNNALTYTEEGGSVFIHSMTDKHTVTIAFKDTGVGIAKDVLSKIFDPFFRADESRNTHGAGLGLTLAQKIVENHHGFIRVESEVGKGTEVSITLPLSK